MPPRNSKMNKRTEKTNFNKIEGSGSKSKKEADVKRPLTGAKWWALNVIVPLLGAGGLVTLVQLGINEYKKKEPKPEENIIAPNAPQTTIKDISNSTVVTNNGDGPVTVKTNIAPSNSDNRSLDIKDMCRSELSFVAGIDENSPQNLRGQLLDAAVSNTVMLNALLNEAAFKGNKNCVLAALTHGAQANGQATLMDVTTGVTTRQTPLIYAILGGSEEIVKVLIESGANADLLAKNSFPPIVSAARHSENMALALLPSASKVNVQDEHGQTALHVAAKNGYLELAKALVSKGADPHIEELNNKLTPIEFARNAGKDNIVSYFENM